MKRDYVPRATKRTRRRILSAPTLDGAYTKDQIEFLTEMDRWKRENGKPFPTWCEVLDVLRSLGYRKEDNHGSSEAI